MRKFLKGIAAVLVLAGGLSLWNVLAPAPGGGSRATAIAEPVTDFSEEAAGLHEPIQPIPVKQTLAARKVALGKRLFHDVRLSGDLTVSCASCHDLAKGGTDNRAKSPGIYGQISDLNSPTVLNAGFNFKHFWDGRADTLEEQAGGPILNPREMGGRWPDILARLNQDAGLVAEFKEEFPAGVSATAITESLAAFVRSLATPHCRFDRFLRGDPSALTEPEARGYALFKGLGCIRCHQGINVGGNIFAKVGVLGDYFKDRGKITPADYGRFNVTGKAEDRFVFKVPGLRNASLTAPYFHDGSVATLEDAVALMARYQLGKAIPADDIARIVDFLKTLTPEESRN
jgi:cytochrome c peroxidase